MPVPPQTVSGALAKEMYMNKMGFDPLEQIRSINSEEYDVVSNDGLSTRSALTKYVHSLQNWSPQGKGTKIEAFTLGASAHAMKTSMRFQMQNNTVAHAGDGRFDPRGVQYGDVINPRVTRTRNQYTTVVPQQRPQAGPQFDERYTPDLAVDGI